MVLFFIKWLEKKRAFSWIITLITAFLIFYISSLTFPPGRGTGYLSYIYHFTAFSYLTLFLLMALTKGNSKNPRLIVFGIIIAIIYGILDEIHQYYVPGRFFAIKDMLINSFGILITSIAYSNYIGNGGGN